MLGVFGAPLAGGTVEREEGSHLKKIGFARKIGEPAEPAEPKKGAWIFPDEGKFIAGLKDEPSSWLTSFLQPIGDTIFSRRVQMTDDDEEDDE